MTWARFRGAADFPSGAADAVLRAPYAMLARVLGEPDDDDVPEKCSTWWMVRGAKKEIVVVEDWQDEDDRSFDVVQFRMLPHYDWRVIGNKKDEVEAFCRWCSSRVIEEAKSVRTLTPEAKAKVNELIKNGVSLNDAMKQAATWAAQDAGERFAWPVVKK
jgi:hypothetical protein